VEAAVAELERGSIEVAGVRRTYWATGAPRVPGQPPGTPVLIVLHASGMEDGANSGRRILGPGGHA
jgi:poly(3-hydroxybutyrate) depolymerase